MGLQINPEDFDPRRAKSLKDVLAQYNGLFSSASLRAYIYRAEPHLNSRGERVGGNGLAGAIRRIGGRYGKVVADPVLLDKWLSGQPNPGSDASI